VSALPLYLMPWCASKRDFRPRRIATVSSTEGSARRSSGNAATARDPSRIRRGTRCRSWRRCIFRAPEESAGFRGSRRRASADAAPAPISVWISSMNRIAFGLSTSCFSTAFSRCSKSPRYLVPRAARPCRACIPGSARGSRGPGLRRYVARGPRNGRLAHARLAHEQRIVLAPAAQRLDDALDLALAADQRIDLADQRLRVEVERVRLERAA